MTFRLNRKELVACAGMSLSKYKTLRERDQLPFIDDALASEELEEKQDRRQRRFTVEHAMRLRAHDELVTSGTLGAEGAASLIINSFPQAVLRLIEEPTDYPVWFGAVFASADHGAYSVHVAGTLRQLESQLSEARARNRETDDFSQSRLIVLSLEEVFQAVKRKAGETVQGFPGTIEDAIAASRD
jgi:hypothetical protein